EIHEAFAAQVLCTLKAWESAEYCRTKLQRSAPLGSIDRAKLNPKGGSVALGHPFAAPGARIVGALAKQLAERGYGRGLLSLHTPVAAVHRAAGGDARAARLRAGAAGRSADAALVGERPRHSLAAHRQHDGGAARRPR